jgi:hypothetical protein
MRCLHHPAVAAALAVVVFLCVAQAQAAPPEAGRPGAEAAVFFPQKAFEFDPVIDGVKVVHEFTVTNRGSVPLLINDVRTG